MITKISWAKVFFYLLYNTSTYIVLAHIINTTVTYDTVNDKDYSSSSSLDIEIIKLFSWHVSAYNDVVLKRNLTIYEALHGKDVDVEIERIVSDDSCEVLICTLCKGTKFTLKKADISCDNSSSSLHKSVVSPCPLCTGLGIISINSCNPFKKSKEKIGISFPPGCRPGYEVTKRLFGNTYYRDNIFKVGDLKMIVENVEDNGFIVNSDHVSLTLLLTPEEALEGFTYEKAYFSDEILRIERIDKVTLPGTSVRMKGLGFPILIGSSITRVEGGNWTEDILQLLRDDLIIYFELEPEAKEEVNSHSITPLADGVLEIDSQGVLDLIMEKMENRKKDQTSRNMLMFLSKHNKKEKVKDY